MSKVKNIEGGSHRSKVMDGSMLGFNGGVIRVCILARRSDSLGAARIPAINNHLGRTEIDMIDFQSHSLR
jgi:hypothetical protein